MTNEAVDPTTLDRHVYTVELRFWGGALVPREISQRLSLEPSIVQEFSGIRQLPRFDEKLVFVFLNRLANKEF